MGRRTLHAAAIGMLSAMIAWASGTGCAGDPTPLGPEQTTAGVEADRSAPSDGAAGTTRGSADPDTLDWIVVTSQLVTPQVDTVVRGSRYEIFFPRESLAEPALITIRERDPLIADVELGPDGLTFKAPVEVVIRYQDTAVDPDSKKYKGLPLGVFWYDPETRQWEPIPFEADKSVKEVRFKVTHFSRYGLSDAVTDGEWQWNRGGRPRNRIECGGGR